MNRLILFFISPLVLLALALPVGAAAPSGQKIFRQRGCTRCHATKKPSTTPTRRAFLAKKGPDLWYAGSKYRKGWISGWLRDPRPIRPLAFNSLTKKNPADHPRLAPKEAVAVEAYLMGLKAPDLVRPVGIMPGVNVRGRIVFIKKFACYGCHLVKVRGTLAGGLSGPSFEGTRHRLNPDWIYAFLTNQRAFEPVGRMPVFSGLATDAQMRALAAYVAGLE